MKYAPVLYTRASALDKGVAVEGYLPAPSRYVGWINQNIGFNPRGQQHSDYLSKCILQDLRRESPTLAADLDGFNLTYALNREVRSLVWGRDVDLAIFDPQEAGPLEQVRVGVEHKTIMTPHGKARKNRLGDIVAYCNHLHNHSARAVAGATVVINTSSEYENPNGFAPYVVRPQLDVAYIR